MRWRLAVETAVGLQVEATAGRRLLPSGRMIVRFVAEHVPGIGQTRADRLWEAFGANLAEVLADDGAVDDISAALDPERPVLARRLALMAMSAWKDAAGEAALVDWLARQGVDDLKIVRRLHRILGEAAVEHLAANPYSMVPLLSWSRLDPIGRRLLIEEGRDPRSDARRVTGAADEIVKRMLRRGDTASSTERFAGEMARLLGSTLAPIALLDVARRNGAVVEDGDLLRAPGAAAIEDGLVRLLKAFQVGGDAPAAVRSASGWSDYISQAEDASGPLSSDQRAAVAAILSRPLSCLAGGAGTGKTYACRVLCDLWVRQGGDVVLCALAGKAALRLSRSTGRLARTLARTLAELDERDELEEEIGGGEDGGTPKQRDRLKELCRLIENPTVRHQVVLLMAQNRSLYRQLNIVKQDQKNIPIRIEGVSLAPADDLALSDAEVESIRDFIDPKKMKSKHLQPTPHSGVKLKNGRPIADPGFLDALSKIVRSYEPR